MEPSSSRAGITTAIRGEAADAEASDTGGDQGVDLDQDLQERRELFQGEHVLRVGGGALGILVDLGCRAWVSNFNNQGLTVDSIGGFSQQDCDIPHRVSCCAPVP